MKFLLDENFPKSAELQLTKQGHEVLDIRGTALQGANDQQLFDLAQQNQAILLTTDRDYYHTIPLQYVEHYGVIVIALKQPNRKSILDRLEWALARDFASELQNTVIMLRDNSYRILAK